jgi:hypothetical protein
MNSHEVTAAALAALLTIAAAPLSRIRHGALSVVVTLARVALPAAVAACGALAVRPDLAPPRFSDVAGQIAEAAQLPIPSAQPALLWLATAGVVLAAGLPVLAHLEYARRAALLTRLLAALHRDAAAAVAAIERTDSPSPPGQRVAPAPAPAGDVAAGVAVLRAVLDDPDRRPARPRPPLIKDYMAESGR